MKIGIISSMFAPDPAGNANLAYKKYLWLKKKDIDTKVISFTPRYSDVESIPVHIKSNKDFTLYQPFSRRGKKGLFFKVIEIYQLTRIIIKQFKDRDIIETIGWTTLNIALFFAKSFISCKKFVMLFVGNDGWMYKPKKLFQLRKKLADMSYVISNSYALKNYLQEKGLLIHDVIFSDVDTSEFSKQSNKPKPNSILMVKGLYPVGGANVAVEALKSLHEEGIDFSMSFAGDGPLRKSLEENVDKYGMSGKVRFLGNVSNERIPELLAQTEIFVLSSDLESSPRVIAEAMAMGKPVVATAAGGTTEFVIHEKTGLLSPVGDAKALSDNIKRLLTDKSLGENLAKNGYKFVLENASSEVCFAKFLKIYKKLLSE